MKIAGGASWTQHSNTRWISACAILAVLFAGAILVPFFTTAQEKIATVNKKGAVRVQMRNVMYHFTDSVAAHIKTLNGEVIPTGENKFPIFDNKNSFDISISSAEIAITTASLANVLNTYVFARSDAPMKRISVTIENGKLKIKGRLHEKGDIPFETDGVLSAMPDGRIRLHSEKIRALHLPVKELMDLLNVQIADLVKTGKVPGVATEQNDLILDLSKILPPPHIQGKVSGIRLAGNTLMETFGTEEKGIKYLRWRNYMSYEGNDLRFGKLTMNDSDLILIDMDPGDPFDFFLDHYKEQLAPGYTKITSKFGLRVFMKDYSKLMRGTSGQTPKKECIHNVGTARRHGEAHSSEDASREP